MKQSRWRSVLFVPGDRPDRVEGAASRGADAVVIDLEDAVAPAAKDRARRSVADLLRSGLSGRTLVRVNAADGGELARDVETLAPVLDRIEAIVLPKVEGPDDVHRLAELLGQATPLIVPTIETAAGVFEARATAAASRRVATLLFGPADLSADLGVEPTPGGSELAGARGQVVLAAAAAGIAAPLDGPHLRLRDDEGLAESTRTARTLGFGGKAVIHPEQIPTVHAVYAPRENEITWAKAVLAAAESAAAENRGVARLADGTFVDEPIVVRARALLGDQATGGVR